MANSIQYGAPETIVSLLTTQLNALASNGITAASSTQDQDANEFIFADFELTVTFATAPVAGTRCVLYAAESIDGTNFGTVSGELTGHVLGLFILDAVTSLQRVVVRNVQMPAADFQVYLLNESGQAFPASGSTVKMRRYNNAVV